jgi:hypothetical protein
MSKQFKQVTRYTLLDTVNGVCVVLAVMVAVMLFIYLMVRQSNFSINGGEFAFWIFFLVLGAAGIREQLRLFIQLGTSRWTAWGGQLLGTGAGALLCVLILEAAERLSSGKLFFSTYKLLYLDGAFQGITLGQRLTGMVMSLSLMLCLFLLGSMLSLLFWRLGRYGKIAVVALFVLIPWCLGIAAERFYAVAQALLGVVRFWAVNPWNLTGTIVAVAVILAGITAALLKTAQIRPEQG